MFRLRVSDKTPENKVKRLVKQRKNRRVKDILKSTSPFESIPNFDTTTLHVAAKYDNLELTMFLVKSGVDVDSRDTSGATPLTTAVLNRSYRVVNFLLTSNAQICITDDEDRNALQLALRTRAPEYAIKYFVDSLSSSGLDSDVVAEILTRSDFPLEYLSLVEDTELQRAILERRDSIGYWESLELVRRAMRTSDARTLATLMHHGPDANARKSIFATEFARVLESRFSSARYATSLIRQLVALDAVHGTFVRYLETAFHSRNKRCVRLLLDSGIHAHVRDQDLRVYLFGNRRLDAIELAGPAFDANARGRRGLSALHYAVRAKLARNARYLLDRGADPNGRDERGISPLFCVRDLECLRLLLERGADVQAAKNDGSTVLDGCRMELLPVVVAHVAVVEARGERIERKTWDAIEALPHRRAFYDECRRQIDWMRTRWVFEHGTLFDVLAGRVDELVPRMRSLRRVVDFKLYKRHLCGYYYSTVERRLKRATKIYELRCRAGRMVSDCVGVFDADHLVIDRIVSYLTYKDLLRFK